MNRTFRPSLCVAIAALLLPSQLAAAGPPVAHMVFFTMKQDSEEARQKLVNACQEYLSGHDGTTYFSVGTRARDLQREVNVLDFDVALHLVFRDRAAHDQYQEDSRHLAFIEKYSDLWKSVRVFDSYLAAGDGDQSPGRKREGDQSRRVPLPDPASRFAGMIRAEVVEKRDGHAVVVVREVTKEWKHSHAENAESLVGKRVLVGAAHGEGNAVGSIHRFINSLSVGERVALDVAHRQGEVLTVLELTEEQRSRVQKLPPREGS